jgi:AcrR family transcriptional regulator
MPVRSSRPRLARAAQTADTRRRLLDAARRVFVQRGYHAASLDHVVAEAGFTKGVVYSRFRSKAELFLALLAERIDGRIAEMRAAVVGATDPAQTLSRQWDEKLRRDEQWSLLLIEFRLHAARVPALNRRYAALHARLRAAMATLIEADTRASGETLTVSAEDLARASLCLGTGAVLERCADGAAFPPHLMETANRAMVEGFRAAGAKRMRRTGS